MSTVLITGSTGFLGSYLVDHCLRSGLRVLAQTRRSVRARDPRIVPVVAGLHDTTKLAEAMLEHGCEGVFHLAAALPGDAIDASTFAMTNVVGTASLLDAFERSSATDFVLASSVYLVGRPRAVPLNETHRAAPSHPYFASKLAAEVFCEAKARQSGKRVNALRISSPYGLGMPDTVLAKFLAIATAGGNVTVLGTGNRVQSFVHADDVARAFLHLRSLRKQLGVVLLGGEHVSMLELAALALECAGRSPAQVVVSGQPDIEEDFRWIIGPGKLAETGYSPRIPLSQGCRDLAESLRHKVLRRPWWSE